MIASCHIAVLVGVAGSMNFFAHVQADEETVIVDAEMFDLMCFTVERASVYKAAIVRQSSQELQELEAFCGLSDRQRRKLELAARGDIKDYFDRVDELRRKNVGARMTAGEYRDLQVELGQHCRAVRSVVTREDSLFQKTLQHALTDQQRPGYADLMHHRDVKVIDNVLREWDSRAFGIILTDDERYRLSELLLKRSDPPTSWNDGVYYVLLLQMGNLQPEIRPLFNDDEWSYFQQELTEARQRDKKLGVRPMPTRERAEAAP